MEEEELEVKEREDDVFDPFTDDVEDEDDLF